MSDPVSEAAKVTVTEAAKAAAEAAAQAGADSLLDSFGGWIDSHWGAIFIALALFRLSQPLLWKMVQKTHTKWDDAALRALAWVVGAVERKRGGK